MPKKHVLAVASIVIEDFEKAKKGNDYMGDVFVIYKLVTNVFEFDKGLQYGLKSSGVWHRYSEFDLLYQYLLHTYPSHIIPPLPEKKLSANLWTKMTTDKFDGEYLEHRKIGLEKFIHRIASHPTLHNDDIFKAFLMKGEEWKEMADSTEFRAKNEGYIKGITASYQLKHCDPRFSELRTYSEELEARITALLKVTQSISAKHRQSYNHYKDFGKTFSDWSAIETTLAIPLQKIGHHLDNLEGAGNVLLLEEDVKFDENMREFANYSYSLKDFIRKYELLQYKIEVLEGTIENKKISLAALGNPEAVEDDVTAEGKPNIGSLFKQSAQQKETRRNKFLVELSEAEEQLGPALSDLEQFLTEAEVEIDLWKKDKFESLSQTLRIYAKLQLQHAQQGLQCWNAVKSAVSKTDK